MRTGARTAESARTVTFHTMSDLPAWVGIVLAVLIFLGIVLEGMGLLVFEWLERRLSRKQKIAGTAVLIVIAFVMVACALLKFYGR